jgi:arsenate reductase
MAEGFFRHHGGDKLEVFSAGVVPIGVDERAIAVMGELGIDISNHTSNFLKEYLRDRFDYVITVCDNAAERCPIFPGETTRLHWPFEDPYFAEGTREQELDRFRQVRDKIGRQVKSWLSSNNLLSERL